MNDYNGQAVLLHIGLHKTASTYLQESVFRPSQNIQFVSREITQRDKYWNMLQYADESTYDSASAQQAIRIQTAGDLPLVISDESLSGKPVGFQYTNRSRTIQRLSSIFPEAHIVVFIRDQVDILTSHYHSYVRMRYGTLPPSDFVWVPGRSSNAMYYDTNSYRVHVDGFLYSRLVNLLTSYFDSVTVLTYEDLAANPMSAISAIEGILGTQLTRESQQFRNVSPSSQALSLRRRLNQLAPWLPAKSLNAVMNAYSHLPHENSNAVRAQIRRSLGDYFSDDNLRLQEMLPTVHLNNVPGKYPTA